jgi:hypothetical protein
MKNPDYKFVARMDADDISMPERFEKQRNYLLAKPDISIVGCWYQEIDDNGRHLSNRKLPVDHNALVMYYYWRAPLAHPSVIYRRELIEKAGNYPTDTILMEDNMLWGRALLAGLKFGNIPENLFKFRKDKDFFKRRSGIKYGWSFITSKMQVNRMLNAPLYSYFLSCGIGLLKMLPAFLLRKTYHLN